MPILHPSIEIKKIIEYMSLSSLEERAGLEV